MITERSNSSYVRRTAGLGYLSNAAETDCDSRKDRDQRGRGHVQSRQPRSTGSQQDGENLGCNIDQKGRNGHTSDQSGAFEKCADRISQNRRRLWWGLKSTKNAVQGQADGADLRFGEFGEHRKSQALIG